MFVSPFAVTVKKDVLTEEDIQAMRELCGANAGICYLQQDNHVVEPINGVMTSDYFESQQAMGAKAQNRFKFCVTEKHHSIADHVWIELRISGISKMLAIWLNSLGYYNTSEKSGRYTSMLHLSDNVEEKYNYWHDYYVDYIASTYSDIADTKRESLAKENARMMIGVFDQVTTMGHSTSLRCWNYIINWADHYYDWATQGGYKKEDLPLFYHKFYGELCSLRDELIALGLRIDDMQDEKYPFPNTLHFPILGHKHPFGVLETRKQWGTNKYLVDCTVQNNTVTFVARVSFNCYAQLERHRKIRTKFYPCLVGVDVVDKADAAPLSYDMETRKMKGYLAKEDYYVTPPVLTGDALNQWYSDLRELDMQEEYANPRIGSTVWVKATCDIEDILPAVIERNCGNAQYEIRYLMQALRDAILQLTADDEATLDWATVEMLNRIRAKSDANRGFTRCNVNKCSKPCKWKREREFTL